MYVTKRHELQRYVADKRLSNCTIIIIMTIIITLTPPLFRMALASSRPDYLPTLSVAKTSSTRQTPHLGD